MEKLIFILPVLTIIIFIVNIIYRGNTIQSFLLFVLAFLPLMDLKITLEAWGGFKIFDAVCFYAIVFLFKDFITSRLTKRSNFFLFLFVSLAIIIVLGGIASEFPSKTYLNLIKVLPIFIFSRFLIIECVNNNTFHFKVVKALKISYLFALVFIALQMVIGLKFTFYPGLSINTVDPVFHVVRYPGFFFDSQANGQYMAMGSFLFLFRTKDESWNAKIKNYIFFALAIIGIVVAGSRSALGGFGIGLLIVIFSAGKRYFLYGSLAVTIGLIIYFVFLPNAGIFERSKNLNEDYLFRKNIWNEAFEISKKHPLLGIGSGNYQNYVMRHSQDQYLEIEDGKLVYFDQPENGYLKILVELGYIGFAIFVLFIIVPLLEGFIYKARNFFDYNVIFFIASLISWLVAFNTVYSIYDYRILIMVACAVVLISTYPITEENNFNELDPS